MRGLAIGEQSSVNNPAIQLFVRSGGFLTDLYAGTYKVESISDATGGSPTELVAQTSFTAAEKVGTGRYAIPTGSTSSWCLGTHRAVCSYQLEDGGPTYVQVIEFEMLDPADWPASSQFVTYLSSRRAYIDEFVTSKVSITKIHRITAEVSRNIERWTGRWFDPRYLKLKVRGRATEKLLLDAPIIAVEDTYAVWKTTSGEDTYKFEQYLYKVYNRHLDGLEADDRKNPHLELVNVSGTIVRVSGYAWPYGNQNIEVRGIFGYTEPDQDPHAGKVLIGHTPRDLARAVGALTQRQVANPSMSDPLTWSPGSVKSMRTRHQSISFGGSGGGGSSASELSGDPLVDSLLLPYCRPPAVGAI